MHQKYQEHVTVVNLKKHYAILQDAFKRTQMEHGDPTQWLHSWNKFNDDGTFDSSQTREFMTVFGDNLLLEKNCYDLQAFNASACMKPEIFSPFAKQLNGEDFNSFFTGESRGRALLKTGAVAVFYDFHNNCTFWNTGYSTSSCATARIYLDGNKKPPVLGKNVFLFFITKNGVMPAKNDSTCNKNSTGEGCAWHVIYKGNMDYLH